MSSNSPHKWLLIVDSKAKRKFDTFTLAEKQGIFRHLRELLTSDDPYSVSFVEMLRSKKFARMRKFRAGNYRILFAIETIQVIHLKHTYKGTLFLFDIRDRKDAY
jgi:mRNA-degrading endonuclease RelE of RelBE toxin-antitoxin system